MLIFITVFRTVQYALFKLALRLRTFVYHYKGDHKSILISGNANVIYKKRIEEFNAEAI